MSCDTAQAGTISFLGYWLQLFVWGSVLCPMTTPDALALASVPALLLTLPETLAAPLVQVEKLLNDNDRMLNEAEQLAREVSNWSAPVGATRAAALRVVKVNENLDLVSACCPFFFFCAARGD